MQQELTDRFKEDMGRAVRDRKESGDQLLRMLEEACDSLLYWIHQKMTRLILC